MGKIYGVAEFDGDYNPRPYVDGVRQTCSIFRTWVNMLRRVFRRSDASYIDASICEEWLKFSNFSAWMKSQDWQGKHLDKDVLLPGNSRYAPELCAFVDRQVNNALTHTKSTSSIAPGIDYARDGKSYQVRVSDCGKRKQVGTFKKLDDAKSAYAHAKAEILIKMANAEKDARVANGLRLHGLCVRHGLSASELQEI